MIFDWTVGSKFFPNAFRARSSSSPCPGAKKWSFENDEMELPIFADSNLATRCCRRRLGSHIFRFKIKMLTSECNCNYVK
jgi:hypothetical protein